MNRSSLNCESDQRRYQVREQGPLGFDYLDVRQSQTTLCVHFIGAIPDHLVPGQLRPEHLRIEGGERIRKIQVTGICVEYPDDSTVEYPHDSTLDACLQVTLDKAGDFSPYILKAVALDEAGQPSDRPHPDFDPLYAQITFRFHVDCPVGIDCRPSVSPWAERPPEPELDYLAKDYASFRRLLMDRLALLMPQWYPGQQDTLPVPDGGVALVELLAYVGDYLSYYQDAVATEAYLDTARQRISVRRHSRLVDYAMHEGCNARTWVTLSTSEDQLLNLDAFYFVTHFPGAPVAGEILHHSELRQVLSQYYEVFEPVQDPRPTPLHFERNDFKDWQGFIAKLGAAEDLVSEYLRSRLSAGTQYLLAIATHPPSVAEQLHHLTRWLFQGVRQLLSNADSTCSTWAQWLHHLDTLSPQISIEIRRLSPDRVKFLLEIVTHHPTPEGALDQALLDDLNRILQQGSIYQAERFAHVSLSPRSQEAIATDPHPDDPARLNRWLLEDVYPDDLRQTQYRIYQAHNRLHFYTWGNRQCCLPKGATTATLKDHWIPITEPTSPSNSAQHVVQQDVQQKAPEEVTPPRFRRYLQLQVGDVLILEEVISPTTGQAADTNVDHRHAVRLTRVERLVDDLYRDPATQQPLPLVQIEWAPEDALPFQLCISALGAAADGCLLVENMAIAKGNVVLADHGRTLFPPLSDPTAKGIDLKDYFETLGTVEIQQAIQSCEGERQPTFLQEVPATFRPVLERQPLTYRQPLTQEQWQNAPAAQFLKQDPRQAVPQVHLFSGRDPAPFPRMVWTPQIHLLDSQAIDRHYVVEIDNERQAHLRFGDGTLGQHPQVGTTFWANYRIGGGPQGNVGARTIRYLVSRTTQFSGLHITPDNPFPAQGGTPPEPLREVKLFAPHHFRQHLQRAVVAQDYADIVMREFPNQVQRAIATLHWTGSWNEVLVIIDPLDQDDANPSLLSQIERHLYRYRRMGHEVSVRGASYVPLTLALKVDVQPNFLKGHVQAALQDVFSNRRLSDGRLGFFHPDQFSFGQGVALSQIIAVGHAIPGVCNLQVARLERLSRVADPLHFPDSSWEDPQVKKSEDEGTKESEDISPVILSGHLPIEAFEIIRFDNDPNVPENGNLLLHLEGGR